MGITTLISVASTAFSFFGGMQEASAAEAQAKQQQAIYNMQAQQAQVVAERNALIMEDQAKYEAAQMEAQGKSEQATAQRAAIEERRRKRVVQSKAQMLSASSGAGALDPGALDIVGDLEGEGEYNALAALYSGESAASALRSGATLRRYEGTEGAKMTRYGGLAEAQLLKYQGDVARSQGKMQASQARMSAYGSLAKGATSLSSKYAPKTESINWNPAPYGPYRTYSVNTGGYR